MVGCRHRKSRDWTYVIDKVKSRLSKWSKLKVSLGGRITLIKAVLSALPTYVLSAFRAPLCVIKKLIALQQRFLWGGGGTGRKLIWAKWDAISVPKDVGGLGVKDLVCFNRALLGKWAWRAIGDGDWLWLDIVKGVGGLESGQGRGMDLVQPKFRGRGWWGTVVDCLSDRRGCWFSESTSRKVGTGLSTRFWEDVWVGDTELKAAYSRLYGISLAKDCSVAESGEWVDDRWVWKVGWRREFRGWELDSLSDLTILMECRKQATDDPDRWEWKPNSKKIYTVRSAYKLLLERKVEADNAWKYHCRLLWGSFAAPKAQATAWRALFSRIATRTELTRKGVLNAQANDACPLCNISAESVRHLFLECSLATELWSGCLMWLGVQAPMVNNISGNLLQFCSLGTKKSHRLFLASLWTCIIWLIWKFRNEIVFNNGEWKCEKILGEIKSNVWNWMRAKTGILKKSSSFNCWFDSPWKSIVE